MDSSMTTKPKYRIANSHMLRDIHEFSGVPEKKYREEFFSDEMSGSILAIAVVRNEVVGIEGFMKYNVIINGQLYTTHRTERTLVSPKMRGKGVFQNLVNLCSDQARLSDSQFCWGVTPVAKLFSIAGFRVYQGYRAYLMIPIFPQKILNPMFWLKGIFKGGVVDSLRRIRSDDLIKLKEAMAIVSCVLSPFNMKFLRLNSSKINLNHLDEPINFSDIDALHMRINDANDMIFLSHSEDLFRWLKNRCEDEGGEIFLVNSYKSDRLVSYACVLMREDSGLVEVIDFCYEDIKYFYATLREIKERIRGTNVSSLFFAFNLENEFHKNMQDELKKYSKVLKKGLGNWVVRPQVNQDGALYSNLSRWYLTDLWCGW